MLRLLVGLMYLFVSVFLSSFFFLLFFSGGCVLLFVCFLCVLWGFGVVVFTKGTNCPFNIETEFFVFVCLASCFPILLN